MYITYIITRINKELIIMNDYVRIIFGLFGGLAIFIFGMNMMSEYLQKIAGERMKNVIS